MSDKNNNWGDGLRLFVEISSSIAGPIVLALFAGQALDKHFGTKPVIFLVLAAVGFLVTMYSIYKTFKRYTDKLNQ